MKQGLSCEMKCGASSRLTVRGWGGAAFLGRDHLLQFRFEEIAARNFESVYPDRLLIPPEITVQDFTYMQGSSWSFPVTTRTS